MNLSSIPREALLGNLLRQPLRLIPATLRLPILQGRLRGYYWVTGSATHGCWLGSYESDKRSLFESAVSSGTVVYDIGANVGFYTLLASELVGASGQVIAFEPLPRNLAFLSEHVRLNRIRNVRVIAAAASKENGEALFMEGESPSEGRLGLGGSLSVRTVSLDALVREGQIPPPHFLKIDVEGAENDVLEGATAVLTEYSPGIFLSTHGDFERRACISKLKALNYCIRPIGAESLDVADEFFAVRVQPGEG